jgi:hypothetical protein
LTFLVAFILVAVSVAAQTPSASVVGRVTDATGAVVPGVSIKVANLDTNISQPGSSNEVGDFTIPYLTPGRYSLEAQSPGFRTYKRSEFTLAVDQVLRLDISLEVGASTESVTVTAAPSVLNTDSGARGEVTTSEEIAEIPLEGRSFSDLAYLTGGVIPKGDGGDGSYAVNGGRADNVGFLVDGMNNTQRRNTGAVINPPLEGVQEFKMITSGFSAEYGRYAGGVLSVVTKSGSNRFRGALYEFMRNDLADARGFFDVEKSKLRRNQFGATFSGPVFIPRLYNGRDRTFFMVTWESLRLVDAKTLARIGQVLGGEVIAELHQRLVEIAQGKRRDPGAQAARGYDGGGDEHSLPHRFEPAGRWRAGVDAYDEEDRNQSGPTEAQGAQPHAQYQQARDRDRNGEPSQGSGRGSQAEEAVSGVVALLAPDSQRRQTGDRGSRRDVHQKEEGAGRARRTLDGDGGPCTAGGEAGQSAGLRRNHAVARQDRELV